MFGRVNNKQFLFLLIERNANANLICLKEHILQRFGNTSFQYVPGLVEPCCAVGNADI